MDIVSSYIIAGILILFLITIICVTIYINRKPLPEDKKDIKITIDENDDESDDEPNIIIKMNNHDSELTDYSSISESDYSGRDRKSRRNKHKHKHHHFKVKNYYKGK